MSGLAGQTAVITGGASGLGAALGQLFGAEKMAVALIDIDGPKVEETAKSLREAGIDGLAIEADVSEPSSLDAAAATTEARYGGCHVLCANVSVVQLKALDDTTLEEWRWILGVNVLGTIATVNAFLPLIRRSQGDRHIVITSSVAALRRTSHQGAYSASKAALTSYGETLRNELLDEGIGVSILFPHGMQTTHLQSSTKVRPSGFGSPVSQRALDAVIHEMAGAATETVSADEAVRYLLVQLLDDAPYIVTHGRTTRPAWQQRVAEIDAAFDRMESLRGYPPQ
ncbi:MAG TPA: SDR family NAD(P)-dependent oxidoreductase [Acidimicrobiales bacterium]|jgi:NAD(P)-dependent dehydrogenase (short-subunit alcohol dehydrogenase family)|nr:SDR family NAD(P)-dependent oxidoreductase [Acidimicrobiales bacterium]